MLLFFKGFLVGIGKIIPGVSGSLLAIRLNIYEDTINIINNLFKNFRNNILYLCKVGLGILLAITLGSNIILFFLDKFYFITTSIFILLIISGIPAIFRETDNYIFSLISFSLYLGILYIPRLELFNNYYFIGFLESFTTIVPGISGTALYMSFGLYEKVLNLFSNMYLLEFNKIIPFGIGFLMGGIILIKFIDYCFKKYRGKTYSVILGLLLGSIVSVIIKG